MGKTNEMVQLYNRCTHSFSSMKSLLIKIGFYLPIEREYSSFKCIFMPDFLGISVKAGKKDQRSVFSTIVAEI